MRVFKDIILAGSILFSILYSVFSLCDVLLMMQIFYRHPEHCCLCLPLDVYIF